MRSAVFIALLFVLPCGAQDLPDPGRRLSQEEQNADPDKPRPQKAEKRRPDERRNSKACENARIHYRLSCGTPQFPHSNGMQCAEAYALYRQSCD
ncbi:MAG TPA: hypothetical protein VIV54_17595 [Burkholderiales bacterium]